MPTPPNIEMTPDLAYEALFQAVGDGLRSSPDSIVEAWRMSRAEGLSTAVVDGRVVLQAWPDRATDFLTVYESLLGVSLDPSLSVEDRQIALAVLYTQAIDAVLASIVLQLQVINPLYLVVGMPYDQAITTEMGARAFADWDPLDPLASGPAFDLPGRTVSLFSNYSTDFIVYAWLNTPGPLTSSDKRDLTAGAEQLNSMLPAWVDFRVFKSAGFILDLDLLDVTMFGDGVLP